MATTPATWEQRLDWALSALLWGGLALGVFFTALADATDPTFALSSVLSTTYVLFMQFLPRRIRDREAIGEIMAVGGVMTALLAVALTGGADSPYALFLAAPSFYAGSFLGRRIGIETAVLTTIGLVTVVGALRQDVLQGSVVQTVILYFLIAIAFSEARRLLVEARERSEALAKASERSARRMARLETTHSLLRSLSELANAAELNPVTVGEAALRDLATSVPFAGGQVAVYDEQGEVVVARRGEVPDDPDARELFPLEVAGRTLGHMALWPAAGQDFTETRQTIEEALQPVALAFDNILLLQRIARRAVQEERTRLARELHDDIGPSLASLGLTLDTALYQWDADPHQARQLEMMRRHVTGLVENVRSTVADLRQVEVESLVQIAYKLSAEVGPDGPSIAIDLHEHAPPRAAAATELSAMLTEAFRNAVAHAGARNITITGTIDRESGEIAIADDGKGFDTSHQPRGHFGLIGIRERAEKIGAEVDVDSTPGQGSTITIQWGPPPTLPTPQRSAASQRIG